MAALDSWAGLNSYIRFLKETDMKLQQEEYKDADLITKLSNHPKLRSDGVPPIPKCPHQGMDSWFFLWKDIDLSQQATLRLRPNEYYCIVSDYVNTLLARWIDKGYLPEDATPELLCREFLLQNAPFMKANVAYPITRLWDLENWPKNKRPKIERLPKLEHHILELFVTGVTASEEPYLSPADCAYGIKLGEHLKQIDSENPKILSKFSKHIMSYPNNSNSKVYNLYPFESHCLRASGLIWAWLRNPVTKQITNHFQSVFPGKEISMELQEVALVNNEWDSEDGIIHSDLDYPGFS